VGTFLRHSVVVCYSYIHQVSPVTGLKFYHCRSQRNAVFIYSPQSDVSVSVLVPQSGGTSCVCPTTVGKGGVGSLSAALARN